MYPFSFTTAPSTREALEAGRRGGRYIAGGTTLVDLMRETVERPDTLVDISRLPLGEVTVTERGGLQCDSHRPQPACTGSADCTDSQAARLRERSRGGRPSGFDKRRYVCLGGATAAALTLWLRT